MKRQHWVLSILLVVGVGCEINEQSEFSDLPDEKSDEEIGFEQMETVATLKDNSGFTVTYRISENGALQVSARASILDEDQLESRRRFFAARQDGLTHSEIYKLFTGKNAPAELSEIEESIGYLREADTHMGEDAEENEVEESLDSNMERERGSDSSMPFSEFKEDYCDQHIPMGVSGWYVTSKRCLGPRYGMSFKHQSSSLKDATWSSIAVLNRFQVKLRHEYYKLQWISFPTFCLGLTVCDDTVLQTDSSHYQRVILRSSELNPQNKYHIWSAILDWGL